MSPSSEYTEQEILRMQQDALRRVQEMHERAKRAVIEGGWRSQEGRPAPIPTNTGAPQRPQHNARHHGGVPISRQSIAPPPSTGRPQGPQQTNASQGAPPTQVGQNPTPPPQSPTGGHESLLAQLGGLLGTQGQEGGGSLSGLLQWARGERGVLLGLLGVLLSERADPTLLLALFYLVIYNDGQTQQTPDEQEQVTAPPPEE